MDELLIMFTEGIRQFTARVDAIRAEHWDAPTPDAEWAVTDLVAHLVDEHRWAAPLLHGHDLQTAGEIVKGMASTRRDAVLGSDLAAEWQDASTVSAEAVLEPGALERTVDLSHGATSARAYLSEMVFDLLVHSWDLGVAIDYPPTFPDHLVEFVYSGLGELGDLSGSGMFDSPVSASDDAPTIDRLVAATGRTPRS